MSGTLDENAFCRSCGYCLKGLVTHVCPECGEPFDPDDPRTFRQGRRRAFSSLAAPPRNWHVLLTILLAGAYVWLLSEPGGVILAAIATFACAFIPAIVILVLSSTYLVRFCAAAWNPKSFRTRVAWRWAVFPVCVIAVLLGGPTRWPIKLKLALSRPAIERLIAQHPGGYSWRGESGRWVGLFLFCDIRIGSDGSAWFGDGSHEPLGLDYFPTDPYPNGADRLAPGWHEDDDF